MPDEIERQTLSGPELREEIRSITRSHSIYIEVNYNGRSWLQKWRRSDALQLAAELRRVEKTRGYMSNDSCAEVRKSRGNLIIAVMLE